MIICSSNNIDFIQGEIAYGNEPLITDWRIANSNGVLNILNSKSTNANLAVLESGNINVYGNVNITGNYNKNSRDVINDTSNYVLASSNILINNIRSEVRWSSNYSDKIGEWSSNYISMLSLSGGGTSQWIGVSSGIYYNTSNVGIGTNNPQTKVHIMDGATNTTALTIQNNFTSSLSPTLINVAGASNITLTGTYDRCIVFPYSGTATTKTYSFTTTEALDIDILVVGGGGAGGNLGGGGGGGDVIYQQGLLIPIGTFNIVVGAGGAGNTGYRLSGNNGNNSSISGTGITTITAAGGGGGGGYNQSPLATPSSGTSSGGGGGGSTGTGTTGAASTYSGAGGNGNTTAGTTAGGGGGSVGNGETPPTKTKAGNGGTGTDITIIGSSQQYGGGGGGTNWAGEFTYTPPNIGGGTGVYGGGNGTYQTGATIFLGTIGTPNTGGGGGGGGDTTGRAGGSGIVIIRYKTIVSFSSIELIRGSVGDTNMDYKIGNYGGTFKILSSVNNVDTEYVRITSSGAISNPSGTTSWTTTSDRRIKENIEEASYDKCYQNINNLGLYRFNYVQGFNNVNKDIKQLGFIAQEVNEIFPKSVLLNNNYNIPNLLTIDITQINYTLFGAVKKLIKQNDDKDRRIKRLETLLNIEDTPIDTSNITIDTSNIVLDTSNISIDTSNIAIDTSNISIDTSNISIDTSNISIDTSNISIDTSNIALDTSNIALDIL